MTAVATPRQHVNEMGLENLEFHLETLPVGVLNVDHSYQRQPSDTFVKKKQPFDPNISVCIKVNHRTDGSYYIVDGQHRWLAAQRDGRTHITCAVYRMPVEMESVRFRLWNKNLKLVTTLEDFRAALAHGDATATAIERIVREAGYQVDISGNKAAATHPDAIVAITALTDIYRGKGQIGADDQPERLRDILAVIRQAWPTKPRPATDLMLRALNRVIAADAAKVDLGRLAAKLHDNGQDPREMEGEARNYAKRYGKIPADVLADSVRKVYNERLSDARRLGQQV